MTNESEQQAAARMDQALRDYASRRRTGLSGGQVMPPHVRRRLHEEIERANATNGSAPLPAWKRAVFFLTRRWEVAGLLGTLLVAALVWLWPNSEPSQVASRRIEHAPTTPEQPRPTPLPAIPAPAASGREMRDNYPPALTVVTTLPKAAPPAPMPAPSAAPLAATAAHPTPTSAASAPGEPVTRRRSPEPSRPELATASRSTTALASAPGAAPAAIQVLFTQNPQQPRRPALNSFHLEQAGGGFQIVDEDGSVYPARLSLASAEARPAALTDAPLRVPADRSPTRPTTGGAVRTSRPSPAVAPQGPPVPTLVAVEATGTNRGLQQRMVVAGNLVLSNTAGAPLLPDQTAWLTDQRGLEYLFSNSRIEGQAVLGGSNQFKILATPARP